MIKTNDDIKIKAGIYGFLYLILFNKVNLYDQPTILNSVISFFMIRGLAGVGLGILFAYNVKPEIILKSKINSFINYS